MKNDDEDRTHLGYQLKHIKETLTEFELGDIGYIQRAYNHLAHTLA